MSITSRVVNSVRASLREHTHRSVKEMKKVASYIIVILMVPFSIWSAVDFITGSRSRTVRNSITSAWEEASQNSQSPILQFEHYINELKEIDSNYCKNGVQEALNEYIDALQSGVEAAKKGEDTS
jgi:hypothetical protein